MSKKRKSTSKLDKTNTKKKKSARNSTSQTATDTATVSTSTGNAFSFRTLPVEIKQRVLHFVSFRDVPALSQVCREWTTAAGDEPWWEIFYHNAFNKDLLERLDRSRPEKRTDLGRRNRTWKGRYLKDADALCLGCYGQNGWAMRTCPFSNDSICYTCSHNSPKYATISATEAKRQYKVYEKELRSLQVHQEPDDRRRFYLLRQVKATSYKKWGGPEGLEAKKEQCRASWEAGWDTRIENEMRREDALDAALGAKKIPVDLDSDIRLHYILGLMDEDKRKVSLEEAVDMCVKMHLVREHSIYRELQQELGVQFRMRNRENGEGCDEALKLFKEAREAYRRVPAKLQTAKMCACGEPLIRKWVLGRYRRQAAKNKS
ncbi:hypothetical protein HDV00_009828 [Rhizophlyctis rosea]|nr:hypothetical protein HDV00_009828 [Rhizophlyctis rosea]